MSFLSIKEVASLLNLTIKATRRFVASGELPSVKQGGVYKIAEEDVERFKNSTLSSIRVGVDLFGAPIYSLPKRIYAAERSNLLENDVVNWGDISSYWDAPPTSKKTFVDLFCGAGGLSKGFELAGLEGICGLDWFEEAGQTYRRNFSHPFVNGDIKQTEIKDLFYETVEKKLNGRRLDVVAGGFPCQGFSMAGNRIVDDPRNSLYRELIEIVKRLQPEFVVCENVKGLRSMLNGLVEKKIRDDLRSIGYETNVAVLCAVDYYVPQKRERVIFIGNRVGATNYHPKPILKPNEYVATGEAIGDLMNRGEDPAFNHVPTKHRPDMIARMAALKEGESLYSGYSDAWKKCPWNEPSCTIKENHGGVNVHPKLPRVLTAREMARLQSFPDDFIFMGPKNKQLVQIGNAVPPLLGKAIGLAVRYSCGDL